MDHISSWSPEEIAVHGYEVFVVDVQKLQMTRMLRFTDAIRRKMFRIPNANKFIIAHFGEMSQS